MTAAVYKENKNVTNNRQLRYTTTIVFTEDLINVKYEIKQINFSIALFENNELVHINEFGNAFPKSNVSFEFTTNKIGKVVGTFHGKLLVNPNGQVIPEIKSKDGILEVTGKFDLNFPISK